MLTSQIPSWIEFPSIELNFKAHITHTFKLTADRCLFITSRNVLFIYDLNAEQMEEQFVLDLPVIADTAFFLADNRLYIHISQSVKGSFYQFDLATRQLHLLSTKITTTAIYPINIVKAGNQLHFIDSYGILHYVYQDGNISYIYSLQNFQVQPITQVGYLSSKNCILALDNLHLYEFDLMDQSWKQLIWPNIPWEISWDGVMKPIVNDEKILIFGGHAVADQDAVNTIAMIDTNSNDVFESAITNPINGPVTSVITRNKHRENLLVSGFSRMFSNQIMVLDVINLTVQFLKMEYIHVFSRKSEINGKHKHYKIDVDHIIDCLTKQYTH